MAGGEVEWIVDWWGKAGRLNMVEGREGEDEVWREGRWDFCDEEEGIWVSRVFEKVGTHTYTHILSLSLSPVEGVSESMGGGGVRDGEINH